MWKAKTTSGPAVAAAGILACGISALVIGWELPGTAENGGCAYASPDSKDAASVGAIPAEPAFQRIKGLAGRWRGRSTRRWTDQVAMDVIAGGPCSARSRSTLTRVRRC
jgi:hypothetical protein